MELQDQTFFKYHPDPMWIYATETLAFLEVNDAAIEKYGYSQDEFLAMTIKDIRPAEDIPALLDAINNLQEGFYGSGTWRHRLKDGTIIYVDIRSQSYDYNGVPAEIICARDVTRQVELEQQLSEIAERAQRLLGIATWQFNFDSGELTVSSNFYRMFGLAASEFNHSYQGLMAMVHPDDREAMATRIMAFRDSAEPYLEMEQRIVRPDGEILIIRGVGEENLTPVGRVLTGILQDVTQQRQLERELREADSLIRMAGQMAQVGGWRVTLGDNQIIWTEETALIHELPGTLTLPLEEGIDFYAPEYHERIRTVFNRCATEGIPYDEVLQLITAQGNRIWVRAIGEAEYDSDGKITAVHGAFQNISELIAFQQRSEGLSERLFKTLEAMTDAFFLLDQKFCFAYLNTQAEILLQRNRRELLGKNVWQEFPEAIGTDFNRYYEHAFKTGESVSFAEYFKPLEAWFSVRAYPGPEGLAVYFRDVTEERVNEQQLMLLETAVARINDILLITEAEPIDAPDGPRIVYVNDAFVSRTGYTREEAIGKTPRMFQGPMTQRAELDKVRRAMEARKPVRVELINYTKSREPFWLELDVVPITDETGQPTHFVSIQRDITERKHAEEAIRTSEERFRLLARATNDVVWDWDLVTDLVWWNEGLKTQFGYDPLTVEAGSESWTNRIHLDDKEWVTSGVHSALIVGHEETWNGEYRFIRADGSVATVIDRAYIIRDNNQQAVRMLGSMIDVSEIRELDARLRQAQKMESIGQLTGGIAHDFNNLLTVILGNGELLREQLEDQRSLQQLATLTVTAAERGAELTNRLLAFARQQALDPKPVQLNELVAEMSNLFKRTVSEAIDIEIVAGEHLWAAEVDPGQLEVALLNLVINARDAMPEGGHLTIETINAYLDEDYAAHHDEVSAGEYVMISVSDTGHGMSPSVMAQAFDPFFTTKDVGKGSGLGLSMVYGFVKQSGGHAKIYSEEGEGTTIKLYFPRVMKEEPVVSQLYESRVEGGSEHILVVEDDDLVRTYVVGQLRELGYRVSDARNGAEALELLKTMRDIDLLFTDIVMPGGMNGRQLAEQAWSYRPDLKVLFTSGYTENAIVHHGRLDEGFHLLSKPYRRQDLAAKIRSVIDGNSDSDKVSDG
jgi:PAS domain S-box-containing protein